MSPIARRQIREDLDLIERFGHSYRERFASAIAELNGAPTAQTGDQCLRLCVESVNMLLMLQDRMASALREMSLGTGVGKNDGGGKLPVAPGR